MENKLEENESSNPEKVRAARASRENLRRKGLLPPRKAAEVESGSSGNHAAANGLKKGANDEAEICLICCSGQVPVLVCDVRLAEGREAIYIYIHVSVRSTKSTSSREDEHEAFGKGRQVNKKTLPGLPVDLCGLELSSVDPR